MCRVRLLGPRPVCTWRVTRASHCVVSSMGTSRKSPVNPVDRAVTMAATACRLGQIHRKAPLSAPEGLNVPHPGCPKESSAASGHNRLPAFTNQLYP